MFLLRPFSPPRGKESSSLRCQNFRGDSVVTAPRRVCVVSQTPILCSFIDLVCSMSNRIWHDGDTLGICYLKWSVLSAFPQFSPVLTTAHLASPVFLGLMVCNVSGLSQTLPAPPHPPHSTLLRRNRSKFDKWLELQSPAADAGGQKSGLLIITWLCPYKGLCHTPGLWTERHFLEA